MMNLKKYIIGVANKAKNITNFKVLKSGQTMESSTIWKKFAEKEIQEIKAAL